MTLAKFLRDARRAGVPLVAIETPDQYATLADAVAAVNGNAPKIRWDFVRGVAGLTTPEQDGPGLAVFGDAVAGDLTINNPVALLDRALLLPTRTVLVMVNAHLWMEGDNWAPVRQAVHSLRDVFKANGSTLVMLAPRFRFSPELSGDVEVYEEPLPSREQLAQLIGELCEENEIPLTPENKAGAVEGLVGLSAFRAEQVTGLASTKAGLDLDVLWSRKKQAVASTPGLSVDNDSFTFADIGGHARVKEFGSLLFHGPKPPTVVVRIEEIEKVMGGAAGDTSGTSQDALQVILSGMEDNDFAGVIAYGPPGSGKSLFSKALANTFGRPCINLDLNSTKDSLVGSSEARIRQAFSVIKAIAGRGGAFFVATANKLHTVPPELRRRFRYGTWMFDLPTADERRDIWAINMKNFGLSGPVDIADDGFSGADIRSICELAYRCGIGIRDALGFITLSKANPESLEECRRSAVGRYMSSAYAGMYSMPSVAAVDKLPKRKIGL